MDRTLVFAKTEKGRDEIESRRYRLPSKLRTVLILVDGRSSLGELHRKAASLVSIDQSVEQLAREAFVCAVVPGSDSPAPASPVKIMLTNLLALALGGGVARLLPLIERAPATREALGDAVREILKQAGRLTDPQTLDALRLECLDTILRASLEARLGEMMQYESLLREADDLLRQCGEGPDKS